jgi:hypothetical protein
MSDTFTLYGITWHHTRLQRKCCECGLQIERGERYQRLSGLFEGEWFNYSTCQPCAKVRDEFFPTTFTISMLMEDLKDKRDELSYDDVRNWALLTNAIAGLRQRMQAAARPTHPPITPSYAFAKRATPGGTLP